MNNHKHFLTENDLWGAFQTGSKTAFEQLYYQHSPALLSFGKKICNNPVLVQDSVHDVFVEIWKRRATLCSPTNVRHYLLRVLRNKLNNEFNQNKAVLFVDNMPDHTPVNLLEHSTIDSIISQETTDHLQLVLQNCIDQLPDRQREAVTLAFYHQCSNREIAEIMAINNQSVVNHINRALYALRKLLILSNVSEK